jgi:hypothetical protein
LHSIDSQARSPSVLLVVVCIDRFGVGEPLPHYADLSVRHCKPLKCVISARIKWKKVTASDACRARAAILRIWYGDERACIQVLSDVAALAFLMVSRLCAARDREVVKIVG